MFCFHYKKWCRPLFFFFTESYLCLNYIWEEGRILGFHDWQVCFQIRVILTIRTSISRILRAEKIWAIGVKWLFTNSASIYVLMSPVPHSEWLTMGFLSCASWRCLTVVINNFSMHLFFFSSFWIGLSNVNGFCGKGYQINQFTLILPCEILFHHIQEGASLSYTVDMCSLWTTFPFLSA